MENSVLSTKDVAAQAKALKDIPAWKPLLDIGFGWLQIAAAFVLFYHYQSWWTYILLLLFVSSRQYALLILLHDGQHTLLHPSKAVNRWLSTWLIAAPCGTVFANSQQTHLAHHQFLGDRGRDPDYPLYCSGDPLPKRAVMDLLRLYGGQIAGGKLFSLVAGQSAKSAGASPLSMDAMAKLVPVALMQVALLIVLTLGFGWWGYFALWLLPLATLTVFYNDFRIFCEHSNTDGRCDHADCLMISYIGSPVERFFFAPNHMNYHAEHHLFPYVPHSNLPRLRALIRQCPEYSNAIQWRESYLGHALDYLRHIGQRTVTSAAA